MSIPVLKAYYQIDPDEDIEKAWDKIEGLRQAFCGGPLTSRTDDQWIYGGPWLEEVRHGTVIAPSGLLAALAILPSDLRAGDPGWEALELLSSLAVFGVDASAGEYRRVYISAAGFAYLALTDVLPVRHAEWLQLAEVMYEDFEKSSEGEAQEWVEQALKLQPGTDRRGVREGLILLMGRLGRIVRQVNTPQAYLLLRRYLRHPWPEVRNTGARCLMHWDGPGLVEEIRKALLSGVQNPEASENASNLIRKLATYGADAALPTFQQLEGTSMDGPDLQRVLRSLGETSQERALRVAARRATIHPKPIFEPDERVSMGILHDSGEKVGIAVEPARKVPPRDSESEAETATRASVRRTYHPAHIGHVKIVLSGRGESKENAEKLALELAAAIWEVDLAPTSDQSGNAPDTILCFNEVEPVTIAYDEHSEPYLLAEGSSGSLWLVKQRDHRPYHQGLGVELALREDENTTSLLRVYARWPDDPGRLLEAAIRGSWWLWREWLESSHPS